MPDLASLTNTALDALEDELGCWMRVGTSLPRTTRLIRYPVIDLSVGPSDMPTEEDVVIHMDVPDQDVNKFLTRMAMEKVVLALQRELTDGPSP